MNTDLGQHFLIDEFVLEETLERANIEKNEHIIEIGPGIGILTKELLSRAKKVTAIELDDRLIPLLQEYVNHAKHLAVINENALHVDLPTEPYKIVANIPYHITSPLLRHAFLESKTRPTSLTLLIQREVAEKICSKTDASMLSIIVRLFGEPEIVVHVPPACFLPPPKVDSSVIHIDAFSEPKSDPETIEEVFRITKIAFSQKRKMLRKTLGNLPEGKESFEQAHIDETRRPQTLSIDEWINLAKATRSIRR